MNEQLIVVHDVEYRLVVGLVMSRKEDGTPDLVSVILDSETVQMSEGLEFITMWIFHRHVK